MYRKEVGEGEKRHAPKSLGKFGETMLVSIFCELLKKIGKDKRHTPKSPFVAKDLIDTVICIMYDTHRHRHRH